MSKDNHRDPESPAGTESSLDDVIRHGVRQLIQQAIESELAQLLSQYDNVKTLNGRQSVVRNGYLPAREILTGAGTIKVQVPKVRDRSGSGVKFNSNLVPPYVRKSPRVSSSLPWLYLKGISTGDMSDALRTSSVGKARPVPIALCLLVGRRHPHRFAQRSL